MGRPVSVYVPCWFVKDKAINFPLEVLASSGTPLVLRGKEGKPLRVRPATLGFFVLLEWIDSPFFRNPAGADLLDVCRAVACANGGRDLFPVDRARLDREAEKIAAESGAALAENFGMLCDWLLAVPWYGYEMLRNHSGGRKPERFLFAGPSIAAVIDLGEKNANLTPDQSLWELPLALAGHLAAVNDCGKLAPARPKDPDDYRRKAAEAIEREKRGELHPWQEMYPELYPLSWNQVKAQHRKKRNPKNGVS